MQSLHKFVCVLCILHIISRGLRIGCSLSIIIPCERWNEIQILSIVYCLLSIAVSRVAVLVVAVPICACYRFGCRCSYQD